MNMITKLFGFIVILAMVAVIVGPKNLRYFIEWGSLLWVFGGTIGAILMTFGVHGARSVLLALLGRADHFESGKNVATFGCLYSLGFGGIGTAISFVKMLQNLNDPSALGPGMAIIALSYVYGLLLCCFLFLPIAGSIMNKSKTEMNKTLGMIGIVIAIMPLINGVICSFLLLAILDIR